MLNFVIKSFLWKQIIIHEKQDEYEVEIPENIIETVKNMATVLSAEIIEYKVNYHLR